MKLRDPELPFNLGNFRALQAELRALDAMVLQQREDAADAIGLLKRAEDAIEALDGTSVENELLLDDYRAFMGRIK